MNNYENEWNKSYANKDNFIFYPQEDVIRFVSKYIKKRVGFNEFIDQNKYNVTPKILDFGCGIGRHLKLLKEFNLDPYGFDLSEEAIGVAKSNFVKFGFNDLVDKVIVADITALPYENEKFDFMLSHGVLDSMPYEIAKKGIKELSRVLKDDGLIYFDVISTQDSSFDNSVNNEKIIADEHEKGTVQTYFDIEKIKKLIEPEYEIIEIYNIKKENELNTKFTISRFHVIAKKR